MSIVSRPWSQITFIDNEGTARKVEGEVGATVMETAIKNDVPGIEAECGGACACATCHVYVDEAWREKVGEPSPMEEDMLDFAYDVKPNSRLSCQMKVTRRSRRPGRDDARASGLRRTKLPPGREVGAHRANPLRDGRHAARL